MISLYVALMIAAQPAAAPAGLENVCQFATRRGVKADTGLEAATLQHFAVKYGHVVPERRHTRWKKGLYFYVWFMFSMSGVLPDVREHFAGLRNCGQDWTGMSGWTFRHNVLPIGVALSVCLASPRSQVARISDDSEPACGNCGATLIDAQSISMNCHPT